MRAGRAARRLTMGAPAGAAPTAAAAVVEASDVAEGDRWKAMSDAFSFDDLSEDDADARVGGGRGGTMRAHAEGTRRGEDRAEALTLWQNLQKFAA